MTDTETDYEQEPPRHPATLSTMARFFVMAKHVIGRALNYAIVVGIIGAVGFALVPGAFLTPIASVISLFSSDAAVATMGPVVTAAIAGAKIFAIAGAVIGGALGLTDVGGAAEAEEQRRINAYERNAARQQRSAALGHRRDSQYLAVVSQAHDMGLDPNKLPFPKESFPLSAHLVFIFSEFPEGRKSGAVVLGW